MISLPVRFGFVLVGALAVPSAQVMTTLEKIASSPKQYSSKRVLLKCELYRSHLGAFLRDTGGTRLARIRFASELPSTERPAVVRDSRFESFRELVQTSSRTEGVAKTVIVDLEVVVRVIDKKRINPWTESPLEVIPIRIRTLEER